MKNNRLWLLHWVTAKVKMCSMFINDIYSGIVEWCWWGNDFSVLKMIYIRVPNLFYPRATFRCKRCWGATQAKMFLEVSNKGCDWPFGNPRMDCPVHRRLCLAGHLVCMQQNFQAWNSKMSACFEPLGATSKWSESNMLFTSHWLCTTGLYVQERWPICSSTANDNTESKYCSLHSAFTTI